MRNGVAPLHPGVFWPGCRERRPRRDKGGATVPVAANPGFCVRDGCPSGWRQLRWLRSRQSATQGTPGKSTGRRKTKLTVIRAAVIRVRTGGKRE